MDFGSLLKPSAHFMRTNSMKTVCKHKAQRSKSETYIEIPRGRACLNLSMMRLPDPERSVCSQFNVSKTSFPSQFVCKDLNENSQYCLSVRSVSFSTGTDFQYSLFLAPFKLIAISSMVYQHSYIRFTQFYTDQIFG